MTRIATALCASLILAGSVAAADPRVTLRSIDPARSSATFSISHIWVVNVTGTVPIADGTVILADGSAIPVSVKATIDARRIDTGTPDRDAALRSSDFFDTQRFPTWTFVSTKVVPHGANAFTLDGNLTLHGVTQPESLDVAVESGLPDPVYRATARIDRHAFGMSVTRLDPAIGGTADVTVVVRLESARAGDANPGRRFRARRTQRA